MLYYQTNDDGTTNILQVNQKVYELLVDRDAESDLKYTFDLYGLPAAVEFLRGMNLSDFSINSEVHFFPSIEPEELDKIKSDLEKAHFIAKAIAGA